MEQLLHRIMEGHGTERDVRVLKTWLRILAAKRCVRSANLHAIRFCRRSSIFLKIIGRWYNLRPKFRWRLRLTNL